MKRAKASIQAEYFDCLDKALLAKSLPFAMQISFDHTQTLWNRICRVIGIPGIPKKKLSAERMERQRAAMAKARARLGAK